MIICSNLLFIKHLIPTTGGYRHALHPWIRVLKGGGGQSKKEEICIYYIFLIYDICVTIILYANIKVSSSRNPINTGGSPWPFDHLGMSAIVVPNGHWLRGGLGQEGTFVYHIIQLSLRNVFHNMYI